MGEPAGIGPDLCLLAKQNNECKTVIIGCLKTLQQRCKQLNLAIDLIPFDKDSVISSEQIAVIDLPAPSEVECGKLNKGNAAYILKLLDTAINGCKDGKFDAMVTCPVQKSIINEAGIAFSGHTEYLAEKTNTKKVVMMLATEELRVALATTHLPLREVADAITQDLLEEVIQILHKDLKQYFKITHPKILVAGLNPHAGEDGHLGMEEIEIINPIVDKLKSKGIALTGPLPADTLFTDKYLQHHDTVLAMYHDQGLPVLKHHGFGRAANITLGLPIVRTSVDHGTALDLAGTGNVDTGSLETAIEVAIQMSGGKHVG